MVETEEISLWLEENYHTWAQSIDQRPTLEGFAAYLGVSPWQLSRWIKGRRVPMNENVVKLGNRLGSEIYDLLGWERPDSG